MRGLACLVPGLNALVLAGAPQNQGVMGPCGDEVEPALLEARYELFTLDIAPRACLQCGGHLGGQAARAPLCCPCQQIAQRGLRCAAAPHHSLRVQAHPQPGAACLSLLQARMPGCWQACQQCVVSAQLTIYSAAPHNLGSTRQDSGEECDARVRLCLSKSHPVAIQTSY